MKNVRARYITRLLTALGFTQLVAISGCADSTHPQYRDQQTEELIRNFYASSRDQLVITSVMGESSIDAYCVLGPYESSLKDKDNLDVPANSFLKQINLLGEEDYWHIVVKSSDRFILIRIDNRSIPIAPESTDLMNRNSCAAVKKLIIKKIKMPANKPQTMKIGD